MKTLKTNKTVVALMLVCLCASSFTLSAQSNGKLLYEGEYTVSEDVGTITQVFSIYENRIVVDNTFSIDYKSTNSSGERVYSDNGPFGVFWRFYVTSNYNIRLTKEYSNPFGGMPTTVSCRVTKGQSTMPVQNGGGYYNGGNYNNGGGTSKSSGSTRQSHGTREVTTMCPVCHSTGNCQTCLGRGWRTLTDNSTQKCSTCKGNKVCWKCNGTGKITKTERY